MRTNSAEECLQRLFRCHHIYSQKRGQPHIDLSDIPFPINSYDDYRDTQKQTLDDTGGFTIAKLFSQQAARSLSSEEFSQLLGFLENPQKYHVKTQAQLKLELEKRIEKFIEDETKVSMGPRERLGYPSGPEDADIGVILHLQTEEDTIGPFWDKRSATIQLLQQKGFADDFMFGYDWHWRAESTFWGRGTACPTRKWSHELRKTHNEMSKDVLDILPLPFLVTGSCCTRDNLRKILGEGVKSIEIEIAPPVGVLKFDLDFRRSTLRRIILHVHHPAAGFFGPHKNRPPMAAQIDAGLNFFLWLVGRRYESSSFREAYASGRPRSGKNAPLGEMYGYLKTERGIGRILTPEEYGPIFLNWVGRYLKQDPLLMILNGESPVAAAVNKVRGNYLDARRRMRETSSWNAEKTPREQVKRLRGTKKANKKAPETNIEDQNAENQRSTTGDGEYLPTVTANTTWKPPSGKSSIVEEVIRSNCVHPDADSDVVRLRSLGPPLDKPGTLIGQASNMRCRFETAQNREVEGEGESLKIKTLVVNDSRKRKKSQGVYQDVAVEIPEPYDDLLAEHKEENGCDNEEGYASDTQLGAMDGCEQETFHGKPVLVLICGTVKLLHDTGEEALRFRFGMGEAKRVRSVTNRPKLYFGPEEITLQDGDNILYRKPIERLLASPQAPQWLVQIIHELEVLQAMQNGKNMKTKFSSVCQWSVDQKPKNALGAYWKHGELQRKLNEGGYFTCRKMTNGTKLGRICIRGLQLLVPEDADFETVFVQCELAAQNSKHKNHCGTTLQEGDPASRLGIKMTFTSKATRETKEVWAALGGDCNAKKLNSLVDFLDGMDEEWRARQPRRFLDRSIRLKRLAIGYT
ncbi:hypothetical protein TWF281_005044 [Arthrobotrys megalospora]